MITRRIGVISDTHGLMRPEALTWLTGSELILHAGDIDKPEVLEKLRAIAPITVVRGNVDRGDWAKPLPRTEAVEFSGHWFYLLHNLEELEIDPAAAGFSAVIYGHSHFPKIEHREGVLYFNPGSAGPRRFNLPISLGMIEIEGDRIEARLIDIGA